jgi:urea carboxylase-associated protein 2
MTANQTVSAPHYQTSIGVGKHWSLRLRRGLSLQLTDRLGSANVAMVFYNTDNLLERYNAPDTLKCQHTFHLTQGHCLYSDMGRVMASITTDTAGGHESICGNSNLGSIETRFGPRSYQEDRNQWRQNGQDAFLVELAKYGLGRADLPSNVNWFNRCSIKDNGDIALDTQMVKADRTVNLRIDMDCLVVLHTCPHPLLIGRTYPEMQIDITLADAQPLRDDDECMNSCEENRRGFANNRLYYLGVDLPMEHA